jgi:hypothetical protein
MSETHAESAVSPSARRPGARPAAVSGTFAIGGDLPVHRLGFGSMQLTGRGTLGGARQSA